MTGHAFRWLVTDEDLAASLAAVHAALRPGGRFVFGTGARYGDWHRGAVIAASREIITVARTAR
jgi:hypothetical protein